MRDTNNSQNPHYQYKNGAYIVVLSLFFFLLAITIAYLLRRYGCLNTPATTAITDDDNLPTLPARGMDAQEIESLPSLRLSDIKMHLVKKHDHLQLECTVCINEFNGRDILRILPDCLHVFHPNCIEPWLSTHATCPVCRAKLEHRPGSSVCLSTVVIEGFSGTLSERFDGVDDHNHGHLTVEIDGNSSLECLEGDVGCSRGRLLRRCFSTGELEVRFVLCRSKKSSNEVYHIV